MRIIIAGIVAGIIVFMWSAVSHLMLPVGEMGIHMNAEVGEPVVLTALGSLPESGLYLMPGMDLTIKDEAERKEDATRRWEAGPVAFVVLQAKGAPPMGARTLGPELATNVLAGLIAAMVLASVRCGYLSRVLLVGLMGLFVWLNVDVSYWIWYGFPDSYTLAQGADHVAGWLLAGIVTAGIIKPRPA